jgi:hypothetical protein
VILAALAAVLTLPAVARADDEPEKAAVDAEADPADLSQQLAAHVGLELGGRTSPGGFQIGGTYIYRVAEQDWFDTGAAFTFGGGSAACFRDREDDVLCDHGITKGFAAELSAGFRRVLDADEKFAPYFRVGLAVRLASFADDELRGVAFPLVAGGGLRSQVAPRIAVAGGAMVRAGIGVFGRDMGVEPQLSLAIHAGVEFGLD